MKSLLSIAACLFVALCLCFTSCGGSADKGSALPEENRMVLTQQDTTESLGLVRQFMDCVVAGDADGAASLLYIVDYDDEDREPYPLTLEQRDKLAAMLSMPVKGYEIVDCIYHSPEVNEVQCRVNVNDRISTNWYFKPVRYLGQWYLCLKESSNGDYTMEGKKADVAI
ncbi:MAG: hypothetical protein J6B13_06015 [Muribaculaceae bacterium]|nr:hypothetical protein [Muribaculaceae bacterium]